MNNLGFIGFGSMGSMLVKGFLESGRVTQEQIVVTRKDKSRLEEIRNTWPEIGIAQDVAEVVKKSGHIFICVKSLEFKNILNEVKPYIHETQHLISIAGSVTIENIEKIINCRITKVMPTFVSEVNEGITLVCHNNKVTGEDMELMEELLGNISKVRRVDEKDFEFASEFTSCGPGLIAAVFREFVQTGLKHSDSLKEADIVEMVLQTLKGTARLMLDKKMNFDDVISRVATKGGITEEGVKVLAKGLPQVFDEMFEQTMKKRRLVNENVLKVFES